MVFLNRNENISVTNIYVIILHIKKAKLFMS